MPTRRQYSYLRNLGIAASHAISALIGARYDMPFSAQVGARVVERKWRGWAFEPIVNWLFGDPYHCADAWKRFIQDYSNAQKYGQ